MANFRRELTNLPNLVTMVRVVLIPFVLLFIDNFNPMRSFIASLLYLVAAAGDFLDGYLARKRGQVSMLGKFLRPAGRQAAGDLRCWFTWWRCRAFSLGVVVAHRPRSGGERAAQHRLRARTGH